MKLSGRVALVTGASRGIGRAVALALAAEGAAVAVHYRSSEAEALAVVREITDAGGAGVAVQADVSDYEQARTMVQQTLSALGDLHILVNNAGIARDGLIFHMEPQDWIQVMNTNFGGVFNATKAVLDHFMARGEGAIVNISSVMGERGWVGQANYAASKGAINAFTRCCAMEFARFGVRVNAVLPGFCPTDLVAGLMGKDGGQSIRKQIPARSFARPEEIARVVTFLASPDASYMTGALVPVDGGAGSVLGVGGPLR